MAPLAHFWRGSRASLTNESTVSRHSPRLPSDSVLPTNRTSRSRCSLRKGAPPGNPAFSRGGVLAAFTEPTTSTLTLASLFPTHSRPFIVRLVTIFTSALDDGMHWLPISCNSCDSMSGRMRSVDKPRWTSRHLEHLASRGLR